MRWILVLVALGGNAGTLSAQATPVVPLGSRVRVRTYTTSGDLDRGIEGTITRVAGDSVTVRPNPGGPSQVFLAGSGAQLYVMTGRRSYLVKGAAIGGVLGLVSGAFIGAAAGDICPNPDFCVESHQIGLTTGIIMGAGGAAAGLLIGTLASHDIWTRSPAFSAVRPEVSMGPRGWGAGLSIAF